MVKSYELGKREWEARLHAARELLRGNGVPEMVGKASGSAMRSAAGEIDFLMFDVKADLKQKISDVRSGKVKLSEFGNTRLIAEIERPVTYTRVRLRAKKLGLLNKDT